MRKLDLHAAAPLLRIPQRTDRTPVTRDGSLITAMMNKFSRPTTLTLILFSICTAALVFFAQQDVQAQGSTPTPASSGYTADDLFKFFGYVSVGISALAVAAAAVFTTLRKSALAEWKELAESRKGKLAEQAFEMERMKNRIAALEAENEDLEKKNLRLQDDRKG